MPDLKRLLLISEAPLAKNGGGISQTLFNLFDGYPKDKFCVLCSEEDIKSWGDNSIENIEMLSFRKMPIKQQKNRLGPYINPFVNYFNLSLLSPGKVLVNKIKNFDPEVIIVCANGVEGLIMTEKLHSEFNCPLIVYFMDDWFNNRNTLWWKGDLQKSIKKLLINSSAWIMISKYLTTELEKRYGIKKNTIIAHNPVVARTKLKSPLPYHEDKIRIAYAGSLWPMHVDAFELVGNACKELRSQGIDATLNMYGQTLFYENNKEIFQKYEINYMGKVAYDDLQMALDPYDLLLVCSSFSNEHASFSKSSVQTKITDYLNIGNPILSVGPEYSACNLYIKENKIGFCYEKDDVLGLANYIKEIHSDVTNKKYYISKGNELVSNVYNKINVQKNLYNFINHIE